VKEDCRFRLFVDIKDAGMYIASQVVLIYGNGVVGRRSVLK
jgi:hypothetical protein